jgi:hypothetical protein
LTGKGQRGEGSKEGETFNVAGVGTDSKQVVFSNEQTKRCETSRKILQVGFYENQYDGSIRSFS